MGNIQLSEALARRRRLCQPNAGYVVLDASMPVGVGKCELAQLPAHCRQRRQVQGRKMRQNGVDQFWWE